MCVLLSDDFLVRECNERDFRQVDKTAKKMQMKMMKN